MSDVAWNVRDRNVCGALNPTSATRIESFVWGYDPSEPTAIMFPWADGAVNFPSLLILGIGFNVFTSGSFGTRRPRLQVFQPTTPSGQRGLTEIPATTTINPSSGRRFEWGAAMALDTAAVSTLVNRECLPEGLVLLGPKSSAGAEFGSLRITIDNVQAGDTYSTITMLGMLLM